MSHKGNESARILSRREFLRLVGTASVGVMLGGCVTPTPTPGAPETPQPEPTASATTSPQATPAVGVTESPQPTLTVGATESPQPTASLLPSSTPTQPTEGVPVATASAADYEPTLIRQSVRDLLDGLGGLEDILKQGDKVAIKVNLTGGTSARPPRGVSAIESYVTHPEVVRALGELLLDAGAGQLYIVEAVYEWDSYVQWGLEEVAQALDATLIDLNDTKPYDDFASVPVGEGAFIYPEFTFSHILQDVDVFISVAKMKNHWDCGVTNSLKNLIGLVPARFYWLDPSHNNRSAFHGQQPETKSRLPRVIVDLNRARPIHLALIDGIKTAQGGEGPWIKTMTPVAPGVLIAGKDPVAADAVATAVMGFDPTADYPTMPFIRCDNHLNIASQVGLGTNRLEEIRVVGPSIEDVLHPFETGWD